MAASRLIGIVAPVAWPTRLRGDGVEVLLDRLWPLKIHPRGVEMCESDRPEGGRRIQECGGMKLMRLRYAGDCAGCSSALEARTEAWWDSSARVVWCVVCRTSTEPVIDAPPAPAVPPPPPLPLSTAERGTGGASARAERERRSVKRDARVRARHPRLGGVILALSDDPVTTKVWDQGAVGEEKVAQLLEEARPLGIEVLHDRQVPRSRANIDHLAVAPNGVWVIDPKRYLSKRIEVRDVGGWFKTDRRLYVGGRDKSALITSMVKQMDIVRAQLADAGHASVPVHGVLCFVDGDWGMFSKPFVIDGITVTWRKKLIDPILAPTDAAPIPPGAIADIARALATRLPPAT